MRNTNSDAKREPGRLKKLFSSRATGWAVGLFFVASVVVTALLSVTGLLSFSGDDDSDTATTSRSQSFATADSMEVAEEAAFDMDFDDAAMAPAAESAEFIAISAGTSTAASGTDGSGEALASSASVNLADLGREIVYRATLTVSADDVTGANRRATEIVDAFGGVVFAQTTHTEPEPWIELIFKVLPADFNEVLDQLGGIGQLVDQRISADDVTERVVDLESRIATAEVSVERLTALLQEAAQLESIAEIERELLDRETTLETLRAQLRTLRNQVDLATITLTIRQSPSAIADTEMLVAAWVSDDAGQPCGKSELLDAGADSPLYFCLEVSNVGGSTLTDATVSTRDLRLNTRNFETRQGSLSRIEPGDTTVVVLAEAIDQGRLAGRSVLGGLRVSFDVAATAVGEDGEEVRQISASSSVRISVVTPDSLPGFADSLETGAGVLGTVVGVVVVVAGFVVPYLPFVAVIVLIWWLGSLRRRRRQANSTHQ